MAEALKVEPADAGLSAHPETVAAIAPPYSLLAPLRARPSAFLVHLNLTRELALASFRLKYVGSVLGYVWSLIKPLLIFGMMYLVFGLFLFRGRPAPGTNFPVELLLGIVVWSFFNEATGNGLVSVVQNADMIKKAYFPRWILVVSSTVSSTMTLLVNLSVMAAVALPLGWFVLAPQALLFIPFLFEMYALTVGIGLLLAAFYVYYRDLTHIWEVALQALFFGSIIIFPFLFIPPQDRFIALMNPVAQILEDMRHALVSPGLPPASQVLGKWYFVPLLLSALTLFLGVVVFGRLSHRFGERI